MDRAAWGSEHALEAIAALFPDADLIPPWNRASHRFPDRKVHDLWLSRSRIRDRKALSLPILTAAWRRAILQREPYDWVLVSSHMFAHHIKTRGQSAGAPKLVYEHTPARYAWSPELDQRVDNLMARAASIPFAP